MYAWGGQSAWEIFPHLTGLLQQWLLIAGSLWPKSAAFVAWAEGDVCLDTHIMCRCVQLMWAGCASAWERTFHGWSCHLPRQNNHFLSKNNFQIFFCSNKRISHLIFQGQVISTGYCTSKKCLAILVTVELFSLSVFEWVLTSDGLALATGKECTLNSQTLFPSTPLCYKLWNHTINLL